MPFAIAVLTDVEALKLRMFLRTDPAGILLLRLLWCISVLLGLDN